MDESDKVFQKSWVWVIIKLCPVFPEGVDFLNKVTSVFLENVYDLSCVFHKAIAHKVSFFPTHMP